MTAAVGTGWYLLPVLVVVVIVAAVLALETIAEGWHVYDQDDEQ